jgi:hypothetical protein
MFGWFAPSCPADPAAKAWIEKRFLWLCEQFGVDQFARNVMVLPTHDFFPDPYDGSQDAACALLHRVCSYMGVDSANVKLKFYSESKRPEFVDANGYATAPSAGLYRRGHTNIIYLERNQLAEPMHLVGTMAHELAHARLLGEDRIDPKVFDHELTTDLMTVFQGLGLYLANAPRHWGSGYTTWPGTKLKKPEYMTSPMFAYALGLWGWLRDQQKPYWLGDLHFNVRGECKDALRYLFKTEDTSLKSLKIRVSEWLID